MSASSLPDTYRVFSVVGDGYTFLLTAEQTDGAYAVLSSSCRPAVDRRRTFITARTRHSVSSTASLSLPSRASHCVSGQSVLGQRSVPHNFKNVGSTPGRMIVTVTPAGLERFFAEVGTPLHSRQDAPVPPSPEDILKLKQAAPKYDLEFVVPH
jgi:hypothetical protein